MTKETLEINTNIDQNKESSAIDPSKETLVVVKPGFKHLVEEILLGVEEAGLQATLWGHKYQNIEKLIGSFI
jgi:hypothetical protein